MSGEEQDARWMAEALALAQGAVGLASPNPTVGCVVVRDGAVVGRGAHLYNNKDHAEVVALREAGERARGATAYVTLEPCAHHGRTPPCAEALLRAGVARVVAATGDPNPLVNGQGLAILRGGGVATTVSILQEQARALNDGFARFIRTGLPFVTLKAGVSLDGRIAPPLGQKTAGTVAYLTGAESLASVQKMRHAADAVLTGIGTVLEDNPLLTDRSGNARRRPLLRVILDSQLRLPLGSRVVQTADHDLLVLTAPNESDPVFTERKLALENAGVPVRSIEQTPDSKLDLRAVLRLLGGEQQVLNVLCEGGSRLNRALLEGPDPIADQLCLLYAPVFLGQAGVPLLAGDARLELKRQHSRVDATGSDFRFETYLRDPWRDS